MVTTVYLCIAAMLTHERRNVALEYVEVFLVYDSPLHRVHKVRLAAGSKHKLRRMLADKAICHYCVSLRSKIVQLPNALWNVASVSQYSIKL